MNQLADVLADYVACFVPGEQGRNSTPATSVAVGSSACASDQFAFDSVFIEGHTDNQPVLSVLPDGSRSNLELSARRATNTYEALVRHQPVLTQFKNPAGQQVLSVAAYGEQRPIAPNTTEAGQAR